MLYCAHMTITDLLFTTPTPSLLEIILVVLGVLGMLLMAYGIFLEREKSQDAVFALGSLFLAIYSVVIHNSIFTIVFVVFFLGSAWEYIRIVTGKHKHVCYPCVDTDKKKK